MSKPVLILLHGMGIHSANSFKKEVLGGIKSALKRYPTYKKTNFAKEVEIHSISYDHIFEERRKALARAGLGVQDLIENSLGGVDLPEALDAVARLDANLGGDEFAHTHVLDVILYLTMVGEQVRLYVEQEIVDVYRNTPQSTPINILAHSLGTAVLHDSLHKLYTVGASAGTQINVNQFKLSSIWMFANVGRVITSLSGLTDPYRSLVNPGPNGCTNTFFNVFHKLDPFTLETFKRFDPANDGKWIDTTSYRYTYRCIETEKVSQANTHSIEGYLQDPAVCHPFLNHFLKDGFDPPGPETTKGDNAYKNIKGEAKKIADFVKGVDDKGDLVALVEMINQFGDYMKTITKDA